MITLTLRAPRKVWEDGTLEWGEISKTMRPTVKDEEIGPRGGRKKIRRELTKAEIDDWSEERWYWEPEKYDRWLTKCQAKLRKRWERKWDEPMEYRWSREATKKGVPHIHSVGPLRDYMKTPHFLDWLRRTWLNITGDSHVVHVSYGRMPHYKTGKPMGLLKAVAYVMKYAAKEYKAWNGESREYPHRRRYGMSAGFPSCIIKAEDFALGKNGQMIDQYGWNWMTGRKAYLKGIAKTEEAFAKAWGWGWKAKQALQDYLDWEEVWRAEKSRRDWNKQVLVVYRDDWQPTDMVEKLLPEGGIRYWAQLKFNRQWVKSE